jgi:hypothetical protein
VVVAEPEAGGDSLGEGAITLPHRLPDRFERLEAVGAGAGMNADALGRAMIDRDEHRRRPSPVITEVRSVRMPANRSRAHSLR